MRVPKLLGLLIVVLAGAAPFELVGATPVGAATNPTWSIVPSPNPSGSPSNDLNGVSCTGPAACTAVGEYSDGTAVHTLVESWNGSTWSIVPSPNPSGSPFPFSQLNAVSCTGPTACTAVGDSYDGTAAQTLVEFRNGSTWSIVPSPNPSGSLSNDLNGVSCTGPTACTAVGQSHDGTAVQTLVESWNGSTWTIVPSPNPSSGSLSNDLNGVSCTGPPACTAVGDSYDGTAGQTLVESWNGSTWSIVPSPNELSDFNRLNAVSCTGPASCTAVGDAGSTSTSGGPLFTGTLVESWNGTTWSIVPSPDPSPGSPFPESSLHGVSCTGPAACTAVGDGPRASGGSLTLVESWNGSTWSIVPSPNPSGSSSNVLNGVSCTGPSACTAVGEFSDGTTNQTLVESVVASGYREVASDGGIFSFNAPFYGSTGSHALNEPVVGMATDPATGGYWLVASDGGIFSFDAPFHGSAGSLTLNEPVVGMATDPATGGYWLVASDGGIFSFNAPFHGSMGGKSLNKPIVGMASTPDGGGYWLVASDGGIFSFDAPFHGSTGSLTLNEPVVGMATDPATGGYWLVASDGGIFSFNAPFHGSTGNLALNKPVVGMASTRDGGGYWLVASDGGIFSFDAPFYGSTGNLALTKPVVGMAPTV